jgi:hypothetical protein
MKGSTSFKPRLSFASVGLNLEWSVWSQANWVTKVFDWIFNLGKRVNPPMWLAMLTTMFFSTCKFFEVRFNLFTWEGVHVHDFKWGKIHVLWLLCWILHPSKCFFLSLWSHCVSTHKVCEILQILTISWIAKSLKKFETLPPTIVE